jgi:hypothetical protein
MMNDETGGNRDAFQDKCDSCSNKTRSGIVLSEEDCSERLGTESHWHIRSCNLPASNTHGEYSSYVGCSESNTPYYFLG